MFNAIETIDLKKQLHWNNEVVADIHTFMSNGKLYDKTTYMYISAEYNYMGEIKNIYNKHNLCKCNSNETQTCMMCEANVPRTWMTTVNGTYKYYHAKYEGTNYDFCPICMYVACNIETFANACSRLTTEDENGLLKFRKTEDCESGWCFVHPFIQKSSDIKDNCSCCDGYYGCYNCNIEPRFCMEFV